MTSFFLPRRAARSKSGRYSTTAAKALGCEQLEDRRLLAITVDTLIDVNNLFDGLTTLREAIAVAPPGETINFHPSLFPAAGHELLLSALGELVIDKPLTIHGPGANILSILAYDTNHLVAGNGTRVFRVSDGTASLVDVHVSGLTLSGGDVVGHGGAIHNSERLTLEHVNVRSNRATGLGGGIYTGEAPLSVIASNVSSNTAGSGGGIYSDTNLGSVATTVLHSTINGNVATTRGGGIYNFDGRTIVRHSTITLNSAPAGQGGGVSSFGDAVTRTEVYSSIVAGNGASDVDVNGGAANSFVSLGYNLVDTGTALEAFQQAGDLTGRGDPMLAPFNDYGGSMRSFAPLPASPAVNGGDPAAVAGTGGVPLFDQRGAPFQRVVGGRIDIGAFEANPQVFTVDTLVDESDGNFGPGDLSLREAVDLAGLTIEPALVQFSPALHGGTIGLTSLGAIVSGNSVSIVGPGAELLVVQAYDPTPAMKNGDGSRIFNFFNPFLAIASSVSGLTLTGGDVNGAGGAINSTRRLMVSGSVLTNNAATTGGGAIVGEGLTVVRDSTFSGNSALHGGAIWQSFGSASISQTQFSNNLAQQDGGAIHASDTSLAVVDSLLSQNVASGDGGGVYLSGGGASKIAGSLLWHNIAFGDGGGAYLTGSGTTEITDSSIEQNEAVWGGGIASVGRALSIGASAIGYNSATFAGGIHLAGGSPTTIAHSTIQGNEAVHFGGGIYSYEHALTVTDSTIQSNSATEGGGFYLTGGAGETTIRRSTIHLNEADFGGGVATLEHTLTLTDSTVSANSATASGGGIYSNTDLATRATTVLNSTISGNSAGAAGGGIFNANGLTTIAHSTVTNNTGPAGLGGGVGALGDSITRTDVSSSLIAGNVNSDVDLFLETNSFNSLGYNLIGRGDATAAFTAAGDQVIGLDDPLLGPLQDNGGTTHTHALLEGSQAINAGDPSAIAGQVGVPLFDQRGAGHQRVIGANIDIGAFEYIGPPQHFVVDILTDETDGNHAPGDLSLREAIELANNNPSLLPNTISFHPALGGTMLLVLGELFITDSLIIEGPGADVLSLDGNTGRVFVVDDETNAEAIVSISGLRLTGVDLPHLAGGAIWNSEALTLTHMLIEGNRASTGGGIVSEGSLTVIQSTIRDNTADWGGGIFAAGVLTVIDSTISGNGALVNGGGIVSDTSLQGGAATIINSTISGNAAARGGGIFNFDGLLLVRHSTITGNTAPAGDGIASYGDTFTRTEVHSSIIAGNGANDVDIVLGATNSFLSLGYNLIGTGNATGAFTAAGDQVIGSNDPLLGPLADNGGPTKTHALLSGSPAVNAGNPDAVAGEDDVPLYDQRGNPRSRVADGRIDVGAFERDGFSSAIVGRHIFYNQSAYDGAAPNNINANAADNNAIAVDKFPYFAGGGTFPITAMTSYTRGINGIMVDLQGSHGTITADDFIFRMSNQGAVEGGPNNMPDSWQFAPAPREVVTLPNTPAAGTDRVLITWDAGSIVNRYLQVNMLSDAASGGNTGLASTMTWYYGNKVGDTFTNAGAFWNTGAADESEIRNNASANVPITNIWDIDKNKFSGAAVDQQSARAPNFGLMVRINIAGPLAPQGASEQQARPLSSADGGARASIAAALAAPAEIKPVAERAGPSDAPRTAGVADRPRPARHEPVSGIAANRVEARLTQVVRAVDAALDDALLEDLEGVS